MIGFIKVLVWICRGSFSRTPHDDERCVCGHRYEVHRHMHSRTYCSTCGPYTVPGVFPIMFRCPVFRRA